MQEGDILTAREAAYIEQLEVEIGELKRAALAAAAPAATWLLPSNGLPPKDEETSRPHSVSCLIVHHGCRVSQGFFHLPSDPDNPFGGVDQVTGNGVTIDAWMPLPAYSEAVWHRHLLDKDIGKKAMKGFMAELEKHRALAPLAPTPAPHVSSMTEADCIAADLHNSRNKAPKAHRAQTLSAMRLERQFRQVFGS